MSIWKREDRRQSYWRQSACWRPTSWRWAPFPAGACSAFSSAARRRTCWSSCRAMCSSSSRRILPRRCRSSMRSHRLSGYRSAGGACLIELRLRELRQLFNTLDPAPFHEKDLDPAAEEYIVGAVREIGAHPARLVLHLPSGTPGEEARDAIAAIRHYFTHRGRHVRDQLHLLFARGAISLLIGLGFLVACLLL